MPRQSSTALAARTTWLPLAGTGAIFYRISSKKQEIKSQYESVGNWLERRRLTIDPKNVFEFVVKRRKTTQHVDFHRLLEWANQGRINWIVVQDLDRFGSKDPYQLLEFLGKLKDSGCQLWSVAEDMCMNDGGDAATLLACIKGMTSEKECWTRSNRAHNAKQLMALEGRWLAGPIPYAFDLECRDSTGQILWRYVLESAVRVKEMIQTGHGSNKEVTSYKKKGTLIQAGKEIPVETHPPHTKEVEKIFLVPSIRTERQEAIRNMFEWFSDGDTAICISKRLNSQGVHPVYGDVWYAERVKHILKNPLYSQGVQSGYKKTSAGYYRYAGVDEETGKRVMGKAPDKVGKLSYYSRDEWIGARDAREGMVSVGAYEEAMARLDGPARKKAPKNSALWLADVLVCDHCGEKMWGSMLKAHGRHKDPRRTYMCSTYMKDSGLRGCKAHRTQHEAVEGILNKWLAETNQTLDQYKVVRHDPVRLEKLSKKNKDLLALITEHADRMALQLQTIGHPSFQGNLGPSYKEDREGLWADLPVLFAIYEQSATEMEDRLAEEIRVKEEEYRKLLLGFAGLGEAHKQHANEMMDAVLADISRLKAQAPNLDVKMRTLFDELHDLHTRIQETRLAIEMGSDQQKAEAVRRAVKEIRCHYRYEEHSGRVWSKLQTVTIVPHAGESSTFVGEVKNGTRSGSSPISTSSTATASS